MNLFDKLPKMSEDDRKHVFDVADFFRSLNATARREGILVLADYSDEKEIWKNGSKDNIPLPDATDQEIDIFNLLLNLVLDGAEPETVRDAAKYLINSNDELSVSQLTLMIGAESILAIQAGESDRILCPRLASMMSWPFCAEYYDSRHERW